MDASAIVRRVRIAPRKVEIVVNLIRGEHVRVAIGILGCTQKAASRVLAKLLMATIANAQNNYNMDINNLYVYRIFVNQGVTMKRMRPVSKGRGHRICKRSSSITVILRDHP